MTVQKHSTSAVILLGIGLTLTSFAGCKRDDQIVTYNAPKEAPHAAVAMADNPGQVDANGTAPVVARTQETGAAAAAPAGDPAQPQADRFY